MVQISYPRYYNFIGFGTPVNQGFVPTRTLNFSESALPYPNTLQYLHPSQNQAQSSELAAGIHACIYMIFRYSTMYLKLVSKLYIFHFHIGPGEEYIYLHGTIYTSLSLRIQWVKSLSGFISQNYEKTAVTLPRW